MVPGKSGSSLSCNGAPRGLVSRVPNDGSRASNWRFFWQQLGGKQSATTDRVTSAFEALAPVSGPSRSHPIRAIRTELCLGRSRLAAFGKQTLLPDVPMTIGSGLQGVQSYSAGVSKAERAQAPCACVIGLETSIVSARGFFRTSSTSSTANAVTSPMISQASLIP